LFLTGRQIYRLPELSKPVYVAEGLSYIPPGLSADYATRKGTAKEVLTEILVADLGDTTHKSPHLIVRIPSVNSLCSR
jgi:cleavage and polyadenylation specificity factor subunit 1